MKKKALVTPLLVIIILLVIVFFIFLFFLKPIREAYEGYLITQNCKNSVEWSSKGHIKGIELIEMINCPTQYNEIKGRYDEEKVKEHIAREMWTCWDNFGKGEYPLFSATTDKFCVVCSVTSFRDENYNRKIEDFTEYLAKKPSPIKGHDNLFEAMSGFSTNNFEYNPEGIEMIDDTIDTSKDQAIVFVYAKKDYWDKIELGTAWGVAGFAVGFVGGVVLVGTGAGAPVGIALLAMAGTAIGAGSGFVFGEWQSADWIAGIALLPNEDVPTLECTYLPAKQEKN